MECVRLTHPKIADIIYFFVRVVNSIFTKLATGLEKKNQIGIPYYRNETHPMPNSIAPLLLAPVRCDC